MHRHAACWRQPPPSAVLCAPTSPHSTQLLCAPFLHCVSTCPPCIVSQHLPFCSCSHLCDLFLFLVSCRLGHELPEPRPGQRLHDRSSHPHRTLTGGWSGWVGWIAQSSCCCLVCLQPPRQAAAAASTAAAQRATHHAAISPADECGVELSCCGHSMSWCPVRLLYCLRRSSTSLG